MYTEEGNTGSRGKSLSRGDDVLFLASEKEKGWRNVCIALSRGLRVKRENPWGKK